MTNIETPRAERRGAGNVRVEREHLVLVEGPDEQGLVAGLLRHLGLDGFQVHGMGGKDTSWEKRIAAITLADGFDGLDSLGLMLDGDDNPAGAWQKCVQALDRAPRSPATLVRSRRSAGRARSTWATTRSPRHELSSAGSPASPRRSARPPTPDGADGDAG